MVYISDIRIQHSLIGRAGHCIGLHHLLVKQLWSGKHVHLGVMFRALTYVYLVFARNLRGLGAGVMWTSQGSYFSLGCPEIMTAFLVNARMDLQHSFEGRVLQPLDTFASQTVWAQTWTAWQSLDRLCILLYTCVVRITWLIDYASGYSLYLRYSHFWLSLAGICKVDWGMQARSLRLGQRTRRRAGVCSAPSGQRF